MQVDYLKKQMIMESRTDIHKRPRPIKRINSINSPFKKDLLAMQEVWKMLKTGAIRWLGEVGRRY